MVDFNQEKCDLMKLNRINYVAHVAYPQRPSNMATGNPRNLHGAKNGWIFFIRGFFQPVSECDQKTLQCRQFRSVSHVSNVRNTKVLFGPPKSSDPKWPADGTMILTPASYSNVYKSDIDHIYNYIYIYV